MGLTDGQTEALEVHLLLTGLAERYGYDLRGYLRPAVAGRCREVMREEGLPSISALQERVLRDRACGLRLVERVAVHPSPMFSDPDLFEALRGQVVPLLRTYPFVSIWHPGCATGEQVYSMAILLHEEGLLARARIYATDLSEAVVAQAQAGAFPLSAMDDAAAAYRLAGGRRNLADYYRRVEGGGIAVMQPLLRENLVFFQHNLVCDAAFNEFQLVLCRNVVSQFDRELQARAHGILFDSLTRFGVLALDSRESIDGTPFQDRYQPLPGEIGLYRRTG